MFAEWLQHPGTQALKAWLSNWREQEKERWATGDFATADPVETAIKNAAVLGQCKLCAEILTLEYGDLIEESENDGNENRNVT